MTNIGIAAKKFHDASARVLMELEGEVCIFCSYGAPFHADECPQDRMLRAYDELQEALVEKGRAKTVGPEGRVERRIEAAQDLGSLFDVAA